MGFFILAHSLQRTFKLEKNINIKDLINVDLQRPPLISNNLSNVGAYASDKIIIIFIFLIQITLLLLFLLTLKKNSFTLS